MARERGFEEQVSVDLVFFIGSVFVGFGGGGGGNGGCKGCGGDG